MDILEFSKNFPLQVFPHGTILLEEGSRKDVLYVLLEGKIEILKDGVALASVATRGALLGEVSLLTDMPHSATCRGVGEVKAYVIPVDASFFEKNPNFLLHIAKDLARKLNKATLSLTTTSETGTPRDPSELRRKTEQMDAILKELYE